MSFGWTIEPLPDRAERRRIKRREAARRWREEHLVCHPTAFRLWDGSLRWSRKAHLIGKKDRNGETKTMCGRLIACEYRGFDYVEYDFFGEEEPEHPTAGTLCKHCRKAVRRGGTHPYRRRKK
jgi:hypothetical protein